MTNSASERGPHATAADAWRIDPQRAAKDHPERAEEMAKASAIVSAARLQVIQRGLDRPQAAAFAAKMKDRLATNIEHGKTIPDVRVRSHDRER